VSVMLILACVLVLNCCELGHIMMLLWLYAYIFSVLLLSMPFSCIFTVLLDLTSHSQHNVCAPVDARGAKVICNAGGV